MQLNNKYYWIQLLNLNNNKKNKRFYHIFNISSNYIKIKTTEFINKLILIPEKSIIMIKAKEECII